MKRILTVFFAAVPVLLWTGCASSGKAVLLAQKDPIALVSVVSNGDINWKGEESMDPDRAGPFAKRSLRADPDMAVVSSADELIKTAETLFREHIADSGLLNLAEREKVFLSRAYRDARINKYQINREEVKPEGFSFVDYRDKDFPRALAAETGIQRTMYVEFNFTKSMLTGVGKIGSCRAGLDMIVTVLDVQGKTIYKRTVSLASRDSVKVSNGVYSQSGLTSLFESAISDAVYEFLDQLGN